MNTALTTRQSLLSGLIIAVMIAGAVYYALHGPSERTPPPPPPTIEESEGLIVWSWFIRDMIWIHENRWTYQKEWDYGSKKTSIHYTRINMPRPRRYWSLYDAAELHLKALFRGNRNDDMKAKDKAVSSLRRILQEYSTERELALRTVPITMIDKWRTSYLDLLE